MKIVSITAETLTVEECNGIDFVAFIAMHLVPFLIGIFPFTSKDERGLICYVFYVVALAIGASVYSHKTWQWRLHVLSLAEVFRHYAICGAIIFPFSAFTTLVTKGSSLQSLHDYMIFAGIIALAYVLYKITNYLATHRISR